MGRRGGGGGGVCGVVVMSSWETSAGQDSAWPGAGLHTAG